MITGKLPASGRIVLQGSKADWEPRVFGEIGQLKVKALLEIRPKESVEVSILIYKIFKPKTLLTETFISVTSTEESVSDCLQNCHESLLTFLNEGAWMFKGHLLNGDKKIHIFIVYHPLIDKAFYSFRPSSKDENRFYPDHSLN